MDGAVGSLVDQAVSSPWVYAVLAVLAAVDSFLPLVPSETAVITAGVFAATGEPHVVLVIVAAAVGAFFGDHLSYFGGRFAADRWVRRRPHRYRWPAVLLRGAVRRRTAVRWAAQTLARRGGFILLAARFIPGGRTAVTLSTGAVEYPLRLFSPFDALGTVSWGIYCAMLGYLGGKVFRDNLIGGLLLGLGLAAAVTAVAEATRRIRQGHRSSGSPAARRR